MPNAKRKRFGEFAGPVMQMVEWWRFCRIVSSILQYSRPMEPITQAFVQQFSREWIDAWNAHDLDAILSHYADGFEMSSPMIVQIAGEPSGRLRGKEQVGAYWREALRMIPDLHFEWIATLAGVDSVAIHYRGAKGRLALEVFHFGPDRRVVKALAHYAG